jgi:hypothetical protein
MKPSTISVMTAALLFTCSVAAQAGPLASTVSEPASLLLLGTGAFGAAAAIRLVRK